MGIGHVIPARYPFAEEVPEEGARCSTCAYLSDDRKHCNNRLYREDMKTKELQAPADRFCCMVWSAERRSAGKG